MSRYDADDVYCIPGTAVLKNKAGITDQDLLDEYEGDFTAVRLLELTQDPVEGSFDLAHLCKIHQYLFQDVYEWAGEVRSVDIIPRWPYQIPPPVATPNSPRQDT